VKHRTFWLVLFVVVLFLLSMMGSLLWLERGSSTSRLSLTSAKIGVVEVRGVILNVKDTLEEIKDLRDDQSIKAILVRIESPGGAVGPSQEIYQELRRTVLKKPVVASLGGIAASGGYYIASACNQIVANPGTLTGSIGVIVHFSNLRGLFDKVGYEMITLKSGQFKDIGNPSRKMTPEEEALVQVMIDSVHQQFIHDVATGRNLPEKDIKNIADGRILTGEAASQLGLVDSLGNFQDAVDTAARLGHIETEPELIYPEKKKRSLADFLFGNEVMQQLRLFLEEPWQPLRYQAPFPFSP
jgi:protease-4